MDNTSAPDMRLVELTCRNDHTGTPILHQMGPREGASTNTRATAIGAYCATCRIWIQWVPKSEVWVSLLESQTYTRKGHTNPPRLDTAPAPALPDFDERTEMMFYTALASIADFCHKQSAALGFHDEPRSLGDLWSLINTEFAELFESLRNGTIDTPSNHIPTYTYREEEWADVGVRWFDHAVENGVDPERLASAFVAKLAFNRTRGYRHGGKTI